MNIFEMYSDMINGGVFEFIGALTVIGAILDLMEKKYPAGVTWGLVSFMMLWGFWNIFFYSYHGMIWSAWAGGFMFVCNAIFLYLIIYYKRTYRVEIEMGKEFPSWHLIHREVLDVGDSVKYKGRWYVIEKDTSYEAATGSKVKRVVLVRKLPEK